MRNKQQLQAQLLTLNEKSFKQEKKSLRQDKTKLSFLNFNKVKLLDLIFQKEPKRYTIDDTVPYIRMEKNGVCQLDEKSIVRL